MVKAQTNTNTTQEELSNITVRTQFNSIALYTKLGVVIDNRPERGRGYDLYFVHPMSGKALRKEIDSDSRAHPAEVLNFFLARHQALARGETFTMPDESVYPPNRIITVDTITQWPHCYKCNALTPPSEHREYQGVCMDCHWSGGDSDLVELTAQPMAVDF